MSLSALRAVTLLGTVTNITQAEDNEILDPEVHCEP